MIWKIGNEDPKINSSLINNEMIITVFDEG